MDGARRLHVGAMRRPTVHVGLWWKQARASREVSTLKLYPVDTKTFNHTGLLGCRRASQGQHLHE